MSYSGWYKRRRGVLEHLEAGCISLLDLAVHDLICLRANSVVGNGSALPPGVWFGSAKAIHALCPRNISERAIRRSLEHLERIAWIKRWLYQGKHGNYPILIARFSVRDLSGKEYVVSAEQTIDWREPKLVVSGDCHELGREAASNKEIRILSSPSASDEKKRARAKKPPSESGLKLANHLWQVILANNPKARITDRQVENWAREADLMLRQDGRTGEEILSVMEWSQRDHFWRTNILSMGKLREKFDQLTLKKRRENEQQGANHGTSSSTRREAGANRGKLPLIPESQRRPIALKPSAVGPTNCAKPSILPAV